MCIWAKILPKIMLLLVELQKQLLTISLVCHQSDSKVISKKQFAIISITSYITL